MHQPAQALPSQAQSHPVLDRSHVVRQAAERLGFECLEDEWRGWHHLYSFHCREGHLSRKRPRALLTTVSCSQCRKDDSWQRLLASAQKADTYCLELHWLGTQRHHRFCCPCGHQWQRLGGYALRDAGCPACTYRITGKRKQLADGLTRLQKVAAQQGGICLSSTYNGMERRYSFRCGNGHEWEVTGTKLQGGGWCPECRRAEGSQRKLHTNGLELLQAIARERGGVILDDLYQGFEAKYQVRCQAGHSWKTRGNTLRNGSWCGRCYFEQKRQAALAVAHALAEARGGKCLTFKYPGFKSKWHWLCHRGHSWHSNLSSVKQGHWCGECANINRISASTSKARNRYRSMPRNPAG